MPLLRLRGRTRSIMYTGIPCVYRKFFVFHFIFFVGSCPLNGNGEKTCSAASTHTFGLDSFLQSVLWQNFQSNEIKITHVQNFKFSLAHWKKQTFSLSISFIPKNHIWRVSYRCLQDPLKQEGSRSAVIDALCQVLLHIKPYHSLLKYPFNFQGRHFAPKVYSKRCRNAELFGNKLVNNAARIETQCNMLVVL